MHFTLPNALQNELLAYDPSKAALAKPKKTETTKAKPKFPLGKVTGLIPEDIVSKEDFDEAVERINQQPVNRRCLVFTTIIDAVETPIAILYHYEYIWYAAWLPLKGAHRNYIYGYTHAFRNNATTMKALYEWQTDNTRAIQFGKSNFLIKTQHMTMDALRNTKRQEQWLAPYLHHFGKGEHITRAVRLFRDQLDKMIPTWEESSTLFDRFLNPSMLHALEIHHWYQPESKDTWRLSPSEIYKLCELDIGHLQQHESILPIITTPFFRRWIQQQCDEANSLFEDPTNKSKREVSKPYKRIYTLIQRIKIIYDVWADCPLDYYQSNLDLILQANVSLWVTPRVAQWLRNNMPVASYFNMLCKLKEEFYALHVNPGHIHYSVHMMNDSMRMLDQLLDKNIEVQVPKRWRIHEFHDYLMGEAWKIKNKNTDLPQDLFPEPVRIVVDETKISFFQPANTHQLSQWGQAVRNCVGSASNYADGIKKKQHFIVLAMVDGKPTFTIQLKLSNGVLNVEQIVSICNKRLTDDETELYTTAFQQALQLRASEVSSNV